MRLAVPAAFYRWFGRGWLALGYLFLYVPIVALVVFSFNDSPVPNLWRGFTLKWYVALAHDDEMLSGLALSLVASRETGRVARVEEIQVRRAHSITSRFPPTAASGKPFASALPKVHRPTKGRLSRPVS